MNVNASSQNGAVEIGENGQIQDIVGRQYRPNLMMKWLWDVKKIGWYHNFWPQQSRPPLIWRMGFSEAPQFKKKKKSTYNAGTTGETGSIPGSGRSPWSGAWQVFLPGESHR